MPLLTCTAIGCPTGAIAGFMATKYLFNNSNILLLIIVQYMAIVLGAVIGALVGFVMDYKRRANANYPNDEAALRMLDFVDALTCGAIRLVFRLARL
jgi:hypothetical protein